MVDQPARPNPPATANPPAVPSPTAQPPPVQHNPDGYYQQHQVDTRPCSACGGELRFDIASQALACPHCGATEAIAVHPLASVDEQSLVALRQAGGRRDTHMADEKEIVCQNCGGHTTFVGTMTSTKCPYCASDIQRTDVHEAPDRLAVDGVLPFSVDERAANQGLEKWINSRWFAPREFKQYSTHGSFESIYSAYYTYDADCLTDYQGERGDHHTRTEGHGEDRRTVTETHWHRVHGQVHNVFDDIVITANTGFDTKRIDALAPWPTDRLQPFNRDYMAGHLSRTYDRDVEECFVDAKYRIDTEIDQAVRQNIGGNEQRVHHQSTSYRGVTYKHVLLPIWLLTVIYSGQPLQVYMNGVTGEIHGQRPWSTVKIAAAVVAAIVVIALIVIAVRVGRG